MSIQGFITLDEAVREHLHISGKHLNEFSDCLGHAKRGLEKANWDITNQIRSVNVPVESGNIIRFPDDYVGYAQVSVCVGGNKISLGNNPEMCLGEYNSCGQLLTVDGGQFEPKGFGLQIGTNVFEPGFVWPGAWNNIALGNPPGLNSHGYYKEFRNERIIQLSEEFQGDTVVLDYVTNGYSPQGGIDGKNLIHIFLKEYLNFYIHWSYCVNRKHLIGMAREYERLYKQEKREAAKRLNPLRLKELIDAMRRTFYRGVKL